MGKRSDFKRMKADFYATPESAVKPLLRQLPYGTMFVEPCAGDGALVASLESAGMSCLAACDLYPKADFIEKRDALSSESPISYFVPASADYIITNPPWTRQVLHPMIDEFRKIKPTWLLFDADWKHTVQAAPYLKYCHKIVSVGRVSWMGNGVSGKDNCAWYLFDKQEGAGSFIGRAA